VCGFQIKPELTGEAQVLLLSISVLLFAPVEISSLVFGLKIVF